MNTLDQLAADTIAEAARRHRIPLTTYRVQLHAGFIFRDAARLVPYLAELGVTHLYASPFLAAQPGSTHGYDVTDHRTLNPEIGTEEDLNSLSEALAARGMGMLLDIVPNHMCVTGENAWWRDVLEHGPASPFAGYFDIAWFDSPRPGMQGRLLLPILGEPYGQALEGGAFKVSLVGGRFIVQYGHLWLPVDPRTYGRLLNPAAEIARASFGEDHPAFVELMSIANSVSHLPGRQEPDAERTRSGLIECNVIRRRLAELPERFPEAYQVLNEFLADWHGQPGVAASWTAMDELLEAQAYRACFWRVATDEINYRRFFDVNELAALSVEREEVFEAVHRRWLDFAAAGIADGFRIDHPDGLFDPREYLNRLQTHYLLAIARRMPGWNADMEPALRERFTTEKANPLYVVVEKILADGEPLPADWRCDGTTGYEFIAAINGLFVADDNEPAMTELYTRFTGVSTEYRELIYQKKVLIMRSSLASELNALAYQLDRLARLDLRSRDFTLNGLRRALREVIACFPVYRSYVSDSVNSSDTRHVLSAIRQARRRDPSTGRAVYEFIRDTLLLKDSPSGPATEEYRRMQSQFAGKFQQVTSPVTAKGVEDTAFYVFNRLASLNEVGGEPSKFGHSPEELHVFLATRPRGLSPLSTHDTKRSEDVRARLNVLSEIPADWAKAVRGWAKFNRSHRTELEDGTFAPDANEEYLLYQTLVGIWPEGTPDLAAISERVRAYMRKTLCEAKVHSSWINPDTEYETAVDGFIMAVLHPEKSREFLADLTNFARRVSYHGRLNSLAQTIIRCMAPGTADVYQGTEDWTDSLVDPDNRRGVDYEKLQTRLNPKQTLAANDKLNIVARCLRYRRDHASLFLEGSYHPAIVTGSLADHAFAFQRSHEGKTVLVVVPRLTVGLAPESDELPVGPRVWKDTILSTGFSGPWCNLLTGETVPTDDGRMKLANVFRQLPVAVLSSDN
ncbi:malto-oligosyltrehalose synthase [Zavarzinella formosa]|uniref:malto-oligosyltrehalose synthase n=1 Tax=Zavarzinella formosa TaxID=360055 RepID=UPI0002D2A05A|nr:malto-oligosyltrehalose synthase [Zavarzinella formosa]